MKQFAFPISVLTANNKERAECIELLNELGYEIDLFTVDGRYVIITNKNGVHNRITNVFNGDAALYSYNRFHIDHFNKELVRDIAAACTGDVYERGEIVMPEAGAFYRVDGLHGCIVGLRKSRRPTLAEICAHHGYELNGKDIVKIKPKTNDMTKEQALAKIEELKRFIEAEPNDDYLTDDGVRLKRGENYWFVNDNYCIDDTTAIGIPFKSRAGDVIARFSTREAAEAWVKVNKPFEPVSVTFTIDTPEKLRWMYCRFNYSQGEVIERAKLGGVLEFNDCDDRKYYRALQKICKEKGVKVFSDPEKD